MKEVKARDGKVIALAVEGDAEVAAIADDTIFVPKTHELFYPYVMVVPLQMFAYYMALKLGRDVDQPRIWRKVSRWSSSGAAVPPCETLPAVYSSRWKRRLLGLVVLFLIPCALFSQESPDIMVLLKGPYQEQGLPFLPRDISLHFRGEYLYRETRISIFYLQRSLAAESDWQDGGCAFETGLLYNPRLGKIMYLPFRNGESIVALFRKRQIWICAPS